MLHSQLHGCRRVGVNGWVFCVLKRRATLVVRKEERSDDDVWYVTADYESRGRQWEKFAVSDK